MRKFHIQLYLYANYEATFADSVLTIEADLHFLGKSPLRRNGNGGPVVELDFGNNTVLACVSKVM